MLFKYEFSKEPKKVVKGSEAALVLGKQEMLK